MATERTREKMPVDRSPFPLFLSPIFLSPFPTQFAFCNFHFSFCNRHPSPFRRTFHHKYYKFNTSLKSTNRLTTLYGIASR